MTPRYTFWLSSLALLSSWLLSSVPAQGADPAPPAAPAAGGVAPASASGMGMTRSGKPNPHVTGEIPLPPAGAASGMMPMGGASSPASPGPVAPGVANPHASGEIPLEKSDDSHAGVSFPEKGAPLEGGKGVLRGQLKRSSPGEGVTSEVEVRLFAFKDKVRRGEWKVLSGADGSFSFDGLNTGKDVSYIVSAMYQGVVYLGDTASFPEGKLEQQTALEVFDSGPAPGKMRFATMHLILEPNAQGSLLEVTEVLTAENPEQKTLVGDEGGTVTLELDLPQGASELKVGQGLLPSQISLGDDGRLFYTGPLHPGSTQLVFSYQVSLAKPVTLNRHIEAPVQAFSVFMPESGLSVSGPGLKTAAPMKVQEASFARLEGGPFDAHSELKLTIAAGAGTTEKRENPATIPMLVAIGLGLIAYVLWPLFRRRQPEGIAQATAQQQARAELLQERDRHLAAVKELDFDFESGKLTAEDHARLRDEFRQAAIEVMKRLEAMGDPAADGGAVKGEAVKGEAVKPGAAVAGRRFCPHCGAKVEPEDRFCEACGKSLRSKAT